MFRLVLKQFLKTPVLCLVLFGYLFVSVWKIVESVYPYLQNETYHVARPFIGSLSVTMYSFLVFLFLSFEFLNKIKTRSLEEVIDSSTRKIEARIYYIGVLVIFDAFATFVYWGYNVIMAKAMGILNGEYILFIGKAFLLYCFVPCLLAILIGTCISYINYKLVGYGLLVLFSYIFGRSFRFIICDINPTSKEYFKWGDLFTLFPTNEEYAPNFYYPLHLESVDWQKILFWVLLALGIWVLLLLKRRGIVLSMVVWGICCVMLVMYMQPSSAVFLGTGVFDAWTEYQEYYLNWHPVDENSFEKGEYQITSYQMEMHIGRELEAEAVMTVDQPKLFHYKMTLYHNYKISEIKDQDGEKMNFTRDGDYIDIDNHTGKSITKIYITYQGSCTTFYTSRQGIYLPAFFCYYPRSGYLPIYQKDCFLNFCLETPVDFDIQVHYRGKIHSSLKEVSKNHFQGNTTGVTLLAGLCIEETEVEGTRIIYSTLSRYDNPKHEKIKEQYADFIRKYIKGKNNCIIQPPDLNGDIMNYAFVSDHFLGSIGTLEERYQYYRENGEYLELQELEDDEEMEQMQKELEQMQKEQQEE